MPYAQWKSGNLQPVLEQGEAPPPLSTDPLSATAATSERVPPESRGKVACSGAEGAVRNTKVAAGEWSGEEGRWRGGLLVG